MKILRYNDLDLSGVKPAFDRTVAALDAGDFRQADVKKLVGGPYYRAKLSDADRLLFRFGAYRGETFLILLEVIRHHRYEASRFLRGAKVDESRLVALERFDDIETHDVMPLNYVNPAVPRVHVLDKILSFDDLQEAALFHSPPLILIGSAGSGKTVLTLEKLRQLPGEVLYVTHSPFLVENARNLYYSNHYENERQELDFLSFREFVQSIEVPKGKPLTFREFTGWFQRLRASSPVKDTHALYEEFNGVLTGSAVTKACLTRDEYLALGVRRSIFIGEDRPGVYDLFQRYLDFVRTSEWYDLNLVCYEHHAKCAPRYDFVVADEVQDLTAVQLSLVIKSLRVPSQFVLCGDSNQIVHPNFFSWASVKSYFYDQRMQGHSEIIRILSTNYRNSPQVTELANRLLMIKKARFGSIDRESHYLVKPVSDNPGTVEFLGDTPETRRELDARTFRSARFAVLVMREEDKEDARRSFRTPLVFSIQEAKGLEYESIILLGFVSGHPRVFDEVIQGVAPEDLEGDYAYGRAKDKTDKSPEAFKFYINALYVAITRAVRNLHVVERTTSHRLFNLLRLKSSGAATAVKVQASSDEEWKEEARKLELQGKKEQAEAIRRTILQTQPVPWQVLTPAGLEPLRKEALNPDAFNRQAKLLLFEYAVTYSVTPIFKELAALKFTPAYDPKGARGGVLDKYRVDYRDRSLPVLSRKMALHGVDFPNPMNQTPLAIAVEMGMVSLVERLIREGANVEVRDNWGRIPLQIALRESFRSEVYARDVMGALYPMLTPSSLKVRIGERLVKIDAHRMEFFLLHSMMALFETILRTKIEQDCPAFETGDFVHALEPFPESVIPLHRRNRRSITATLAGNEVLKESPPSRKLFVRLQRGYYIPNPNMDLEIDDEWVNICDMLHFGVLEKETGNQRLAAFMEAVRVVRKSLGAPGAVPAAVRSEDEPAKTGVPAPSVMPAAQSMSASPDESVLASAQARQAEIAEALASGAAATQQGAELPAMPLRTEAGPGRPLRKAAPSVSMARDPFEKARRLADFGASYAAKAKPRLEEVALSELGADGRRVAESLRGTDGKVPREAMEWMRAHREEGVAIAVSIVSPWLAATARWVDEDDMALVLSLLMLAEFRATSSYALVVDVARNSNVDWCLGIAEPDFLGRILASVWDGDCEPLLNLIEDNGASAGGRAAGLHAMSLLALDDRVPRTDVVAYMGKLLRGRKSQIRDVEVLEELGQAALRLQPLELLEPFSKLFFSKMMELTDVSWEGLVCAAKRPVHEVMAESRAKTPCYVVDAIGEAVKLAKCASDMDPSWGDGGVLNSGAPDGGASVRAGSPKDRSFVQDRERDDWAGHPAFKTTQPVRNEGPAIGRNDPCPCGSGKKYKKCCQK